MKKVPIWHALKNLCLILILVVNSNYLQGGENNRRKIAFYNLLCHYGHHFCLIIEIIKMNVGSFVHIKPEIQQKCFNIM